MDKRQIILVLIILVIAGAAVALLLYKPVKTKTEDEEDAYNIEYDWTGKVWKNSEGIGNTVIHVPSATADTAKVGDTIIFPGGIQMKMIAWEKWEGNQDLIVLDHKGSQWDIPWGKTTVQIIPA